MMLPLVVLLGVTQPNSMINLPERANLNPVADTFIDPSAPDMNFGREPALVLGNRRAILMSFPQLSWEGYAGKKVKSAQLVFAFSRGSANMPFTISEIRTPWGEGEGRSLRFDKPDPKVVPYGGATWRNSRQGRDGSKWQTEGALGTSDIAPISGADVISSSEKLTLTGLAGVVQNMIDRPNSSFGIRIESAADVAFFSGEYTEQRPRLEIVWEDAPATGPDLALITLMPQVEAGKSPRNGELTTYNAIVKNVGSADVPSARLEWTDATGSRNSVDIPGPIAANSTKVVKFQANFRGETTDPRKFFLHGQVVCDTDVNQGNNHLNHYSTGLNVAIEATPAQLEALRAISPSKDATLLYQWAAARMNNYILPYSRFIRNPEGVFERINITLNPAEADIRVNLTDADLTEDGLQSAITKALIPLSEAYVVPPANATVPWDTATTSYGWLPDTRDDGMRIPGLELPSNGFAVDPQGPPLFSNGLISRQEAWALQSLVGKRGKDRKFPWVPLDQGLLIRTTGLTGEPLTEMVIGIFKPGDTKPLVISNSGRSGFVYFSANQFKDGLFKDIATSPENAWYRIEATNGYESASAWLPAWQVLDWYSRGNSSISNFEMRFLMPNKAIDKTQDLAAGKLVIDEADRFPAQLNAVVDGNPETSVDLFPGQWIEVDMGRDRTFGQVEIELASGELNAFDILVYGTSQTASSAFRWASINEGNYIGRVWGGEVKAGTRIPISGLARQGRYLRLVNKSPEKVALSGLIIRPVRVNE